MEAIDDEGLGMLNESPLPEPDGGSKKQAVVLVYGNSHANAMKTALSEGLFANSTPDAVFEAEYIFASTGGELREVMIADARKRVQALGEDAIVAFTIVGTQHNIVGLIQHEIPFSFDPSDVDAKALIPYKLIYEHMVEYARTNRSVPVFRRLTKARVYHISTPPPKEDEAFIRARMGRYRGISLADAPLNPPSVRLRLWEIEMDALQQVCAEWGVGFLPAPASARTQEGFLKPELYAADGTHANSAYGALVLKQLAGLVDQGARAAGVAK